MPRAVENLRVSRDMSTSSVELSHIGVRSLGQSGFRFDFGGEIFYIDPYLSDSVQRLEGDQMARLMPAPMSPADVTDADWVLTTHAHFDHCDPGTLPAIAAASPQARFMGPATTRRVMVDCGIPETRIFPASESWIDLGEVRLHAVAAAHPRIERDAEGNAGAVGYVMEWNGRPAADRLAPVLCRLRRGVPPSQREDV
jgi:L-ascorbate 6-phosphate lactonase